MYVSKQILVAGGSFALLLVLGVVVVLVATMGADTATEPQAGASPSSNATATPSAAPTPPPSTTEASVDDVVDGEDEPGDEPTTAYPGDGRIPGSAVALVDATSVVGVLNSIDLAHQRWCTWGRMSSS